MGWRYRLFGAGAIIGSRTGDYLQGIATGALILMAGAIGLACGIGLFVYALVVSAMTAQIVAISECFQTRIGNRNALVEPDKSEVEDDSPM